MVAILEVRCDMDKIDLREETVDRIELMQQKNDQLLLENQELKNRKWWQFWK